MGADGLGRLAKKWLQAKTKELTTTNRRERESAEYEAERTEKEAKDEVASEALMTAFPGLRRMRDRQEAHRAAAEQERLRELASRPVGQLELRLSGATQGAWTGTVPVLIAVVPPDPGAEPTPDPYAGTPTLTVELGPLTPSSEVPGSPPLVCWRFEVPGYGGPGEYDLAVSGMRRRDAGAEPEYIEWELNLGEEHEAYFFQPDIGPTTVRIDPARITVAMALAGAAGEAQAAATVELPPGVIG